jgi:hypothetical protein
VRRVESRRGSTFFQCLLSQHDHRFPRYPVLPVGDCSGYQKARDSGDAIDPKGAGISRTSEVARSGVSDEPVTLHLVFATWWPLAASWLMMGFELPAVSATMARLPHPEISLAAYGGVVFPLSLLIEAPIIMLLAASTALSRDRDCYCKLRRFMLAAGGALTLIHVAVAITPLFDLIVGGLIGAPEEIQGPARVGLIIMTPWTWSIAYRRFQQGVLIRFGHPRRVGIGTAVRLGTNVAVLALGYFAGRFSGIVVGCSAVAAGVVVEAVFIGFAVRPVLRRELPELSQDGAPLTVRRFVDFYVPLAMTSLFGLIAMPIASAAMSRMPRPIESLAVWPVIAGLTFTLRSLGFAYNEVVVALLDRRRAVRPLVQFTGILAGAASGLLALIAATPLCWFWFARVSGLTAELATLGCSALWLAIGMPAASVIQNWFQGVLVNAHRTRAVTEAVLIFLATSAAILIGGIRAGTVTGLYVGLGAILGGYALQTAWLWYRSRRVLAGLASWEDAVLASGSGRTA